MNAEQRALGEIVLDHLIHHPEQHDQGTFGTRNECGTTACAAGWTVLLAAPQGVEPRWRPRPGGGAEAMGYVRLPGDKDLHSPFYAAQRLLGLADGQAYKLFHSCEDQESARAYLRKLLDAAPVPS